jgi:hypothetical protein
MSHDRFAPGRRVKPAPRVLSLAGLSLVQRLGLAIVLVALVWLVLALVR